jgi:hypothetical protein
MESRVMNRILEMAKDGATTSEVSKALKIKYSTTIIWMRKLVMENRLILKEAKNSKIYYTTRQDNYLAHDPFNIGGAYDRLGRSHFAD